MKLSELFKEECEFRYSVAYESAMEGGCMSVWVDAEERANIISEVQELFRNVLNAEKDIEV